MVGVQLKRDETNVRLAAVIGEGFHNVFVFVDHMQLFGDQRQQRALERNGKQHHAENHMEQVVLRLRFADRRHNGEYDGGRAAEAREGDDRDRVALRKGSSSAETASGRAIKVRNRNSSTAGRMMAGIWDGKESRPSRKKMDICAMPVIPSK